MSPQGRLRIQPPPPPALGPVWEVFPARLARVGDGEVRRALPHPRRRLIGAWCFLDHFGPSRAGPEGMGIGAHPHVGLQTVTWLLEGALLHRDSLGSAQRIQPGQLNWMTAGRGISHTEVSAQPAGSPVHGVQLWVALPDAHHHTAPAFVHHAALPGIDLDPDARLTLLAGEIDGVESPAQTFSPLLGADVRLSGAGVRTLPLRPDFEYGVVVTEGSVLVEGEVLQPGSLLYLGRGRHRLALAGAPAGRLMLVGGAPLDEPVLIWWNYVFRQESELAEVIAAWNAADPARFPPIPGDTGARIPSPLWPG